MMMSPLQKDSWKSFASTCESEIFDLVVARWGFHYAKVVARLQPPPPRLTRVNADEKEKGLQERSIHATAQSL